MSVSGAAVGSSIAEPGEALAVAEQAQRKYANLPSQVRLAKGGKLLR